MFVISECLPSPGVKTLKKKQTTATGKGRTGMAPYMAESIIRSFGSSWTFFFCDGGVDSGGLSRGGSGGGGGGVGGDVDDDNGAMTTNEEERKP